MPGINITLLIAALLLSLISSCVPDETRKVSLSDYPNNPDIRKVPRGPLQLDAFGFSDLGAWHAYSLPSPDSTDYHRGFCGPLIMRNNGRWLGNLSSQLSLIDESGDTVKWSDGRSEITSLPGILKQTHYSEVVTLSQELIFADNRTALIINTVSNNGNDAVTVKPVFRNSLYEGDYRIEKTDKSVIVRLADSSVVYTAFADDDFELAIDDNGYTVIFSKPVTVGAGSDLHIVLTQSYFTSHGDMMSRVAKIPTYISDWHDLLASNAARWEGWLTELTGKGNEWMDTACYRSLAVKCLQTLISNWRSPSNALKHNGLFPSTAYQGFYGFWSWDSWKHAVALSRFYPDLAMESIRSMFDYQDSTGMVADCIYADPVENNWRDTKPPLAAWAVYEIFRQTGDSAFVREILPSLLSYHNWWYRYRDHNKNGLCEYGSTDGTLIAAKWESGMDNAARFDRSALIKSESGGWSLDQESVDLNTFLAVEKRCLADLVAVAGLPEESIAFRAQADTLGSAVATTFWSDEYRYFMDRGTADGQFISHYGPEGWLPLWAGLCSEEQAVAVASLMTDRVRFGTKVPLPTLDRSDLMYDPTDGYWRGPVWLDQFYFGVTGLRNYGFVNEANAMIYSMLHNSAGLLDSAPVHENYNPDTGEGLNAAHFSWSAAHIIMLLTDMN